MSDPGDPSVWREHVGVGAFLMGALWAIREFVPRIVRGERDETQKRVTPADVREDVRALHAEISELRSTFRFFVEEERATHVSLISAVRDSLVMQRQSGG